MWDTGDWATLTPVLSSKRSVSFLQGCGSESAFIFLLYLDSGRKFEVKITEKMHVDLHGSGSGSRRKKLKKKRKNAWKLLITLILKQNKLKIVAKTQFFGILIRANYSKLFIIQFFTKLKSHTTVL